MRQALAGMLWSEQFYLYDVDKWLEERGSDPFNPTRKAAPQGASGWMPVRTRVALLTTGFFTRSIKPSWNNAFHWHGATNCSWVSSARTSRTLCGVQPEGRCIVENNGGSIVAICETYDLS
jgi:hypothetical protein